MIDKNLTYAVIGASQDQDKYGYKVFKDLTDARYNVIPINPKGGKLLDKKVWKCITEYPNVIDVAIFVVPPTLSTVLMKDVKAKKIRKVWFQPGSESDEAVNFCKENDIEYISNACVMIQRKNGL